MFTKVSPAAVKSASAQSAAAGRSTRPEPVVEAMEDRVLMSATLAMAVGGDSIVSGSRASAAAAAAGAAVLTIRLSPDARIDTAFRFVRDAGGRVAVSLVASSCIRTRSAVRAIATAPGARFRAVAHTAASAARHAAASSRARSRGIIDVRRRSNSAGAGRETSDQPVPRA